MKKAGKITLIVVSSIVAAILIAGIILGCIIVRPMKGFTDYSEIYVTNAASQRLPDGPLKDKYKGKIDKAVKKTGFSVLRAMLEFAYSYGPEFLTEVNEDGETVRVARKKSEVYSACAATSDSYMLELQFGGKNDPLKTFSVGKETIAYNTLVMNVHTTDGELRWVNLYLFDQYMDGENDPKAEEYYVTPIRVRMNTSSLYIALGEIEREILG